LAWLLLRRAPSVASKRRHCIIATNHHHQHQQQQQQQSRRCLMDLISAVRAPTSFRLATLAQSAYDAPFQALQGDARPSVPRLCMLVFEAVLEVVCVSLPGYVVARLGQFDAEKQKFLANLNVTLFTPCLSTC
jgi:hypothetical protein